MAPEGWQTTKLGKIFKSRRERGFPDLPTLSVTLRDGLVLRESLDRKTDTSLSPEEHLLVHKGDIAYNMMRMWQGASGLATFDALVSPAYVVLKPTKDIDPIFASYLFKSARLIYLFWAYSYGLTSDRLRLYFADFSLIPVSLPHIEEQRRVGTLLTTWDRAIETVDRLIKNYEAQKRALMQRLLTGKTRLKGYEASSWKEVSLRGLAKITMGSSPKSEGYNQQGNGLPLLQGNADIENRSSAPRIFTSAITQTCSPNDILLSVRAPVGAVARSQHEACIGRGLAALRPNENTDGEFLYQLLLSFENSWSRISQGSTFDAISSTDINSLRFLVPTDQTEQATIGLILRLADQSTAGLCKKKEALQRQKRALMQQLLTGKLRLKSNETADLVAGGWTV